jgi:toluene monooxygenase system protein D
VATDHPGGGGIVTSELVGPILRPGGEWPEVIAEAARLDNPGREVCVEDRGGYVRVHCSGECLLREETVRRILGQPFHMRDLEVNLSSFAGRIEYGSDYVRFFYARKPEELRNE